MEKILNYSRTAVGDYDGVAQQRSWDCGPASAQIILQAAGINKTEEWLIRQIGTTEAGTNHAGLITPVLNALLPGSGYTTVWLTKDPPSKTQIEKLWTDVCGSIGGNRGVILNFEAPPWNFPKGSNGSVSPEYRGNATIYHYVAGLGVAENDSGRHIWIADPGFRPFGYWCRLEQVASLIVPHAYAYAATPPVILPAKPVPAITIPADSVGRTDLEWRATQYGDQDAVAVLVKSAQLDDRGKKALALLERVNPAALQQFIARKAS